MKRLQHGKQARNSFYQKLGASVTMLPGGELFQALEKGVLESK